MKVESGAYGCPLLAHVVKGAGSYRDHTWMEHMRPGLALRTLLPSLASGISSLLFLGPQCGRSQWAAAFRRTVTWYAQFGAALPCLAGSGSTISRLQALETTAEAPRAYWWCTVLLADGNTCCTL